MHVVAVEEVAHFAQHDQVEAAGFAGPVGGQHMVRDMHVGEPAGALARNVHGMRREVTCQQMVAALRKGEREFADAAAGLVAASVALLRQGGQQQRPLASLVPAVAQRVGSSLAA